MKLQAVIDQFYYDMAINEMRMMNGSALNENITYNSLRYLDIIVYTPKCTASFLAEAMHVSKTAVTMKVNELIRHGLVERVQSGEDRRVHFLTAKPEVVEDYRRYDRVTQYAAEQMQKRFSEAEIDQLCVMMQEFSKYYREGTKHESDTGKTI